MRPVNIHQMQHAIGYGLKQISFYSRSRTLTPLDWWRSAIVGAHRMRE